MKSSVLDVHELRSGILALPRPARALLARELIESLEETEESKSLNAVWAEESERRLAELTSGRVAARPGPEVLRRARARGK